jgi:hypothetical protein
VFPAADLKQVASRAETRPTPWMDACFDETILIPLSSSSHRPWVIILLLNVEPTAWPAGLTACGNRAAKPAVEAGGDNRRLTGEMVQRKGDRTFTLFVRGQF